MCRTISSGKEPETQSAAHTIVADQQTKHTPDAMSSNPFAFKTAASYTGKPAVKNRADGRCTTPTFWAWNLTDYDAVLYVDTDVS